MMEKSSLFKFNFKFHLLPYTLVFLLLCIILFPSILLSAQKDLKTERAKEQVLLNLKKEYNRLKLWQKRLDEQEKRLKRLELQILANQQEILKTQEKINKILEEIKKIREANVTQLATVYSKMKPQDAAEVVNNMPTELAVKIFLKMKPSKIAKILNIVNREKAISITEKLALYGIKINLRGE